MKCAIVMGLDVITYIPSFIKICSAIQKLTGWGVHRHTQTRRQHDDRISLLLFFFQIRNVS
jgi:hypothetical protein